MTGTRSLLAGLAALSCVGMLAAQQPASEDPAVLLQAGLHAEQVDGQLDRAIDIYKTVIAKAGANRTAAANAWLHIGLCDEKLSRPEAETAYHTVVEEFADVSEIAKRAKARISALQAASGPFKFRVIDDYFKDTSRVTLSPNGTTAAYVRSRPAPPVPGDDHPTIDSVLVRNLSSGSERKLLDLQRVDAGVGLLVWSPDGQTLAAMVRVEHSVELHLLPLSGRARLLETEAAVDNIPRCLWSPDGRRIAFITSQRGSVTELHVRDLGDAHSVLLGPTTTGYLWSGDSRSLAWVPVGASGPKGEIVVGSPEGQPRQTIPVPDLPTGGVIQLGAWTPNNEIAFRILVLNASNDLYAVPSGGGAIRKVSECRGSWGGDGCASISPDGRFAVLRRNVTDGGRIVFRDLQSGEDKTLTHDSVIEQVAIDANASGGLFAFTSNRDGHWGVYVAPMDRVPVDQPVWLADAAPGAVASGAWMSNGMVLRTTSPQNDIYRVDLDVTTAKPLGAPRRLTHEAPKNQTPRVSPDGKEIAYFRQTNGRGGLALMGTRGTDERYVLSVPVDLFPGTMLWRSAQELLIVERNRAVTVFHAATSTTTTLDPPLFGSQSVYVPATDEVFYWETPAGQPASTRLRARSLTAGTVRAIDVPESSEYFKVSADGAWLAYTTVDRSHKPLVGDLHLRPLNGGADRVLVRFDKGADNEDQTPVSFSPNGKYLVYQDPQSRLHVIDLVTSESWPLVTAAPAGVDFEWSDVDWSPDGSFVLLEGSSTRTEWRLYDGVTHDAVVKLMDAKGKK